MSFFERLKLALSLLFGGDLPAAVPQREALPPLAPQPQALPHPKETTAGQSVEQQHGAALFFLGLLQRDGRLIDFLKEDISAFSDADIGAAARVVHDGCKKVLSQYLSLAPVVTDAEGASIKVPVGFDASRFRLTGNVSAQGPWQGSLKHHGWVATKIDLPPVPVTVDLKVITPAEVELP